MNADANAAEESVDGTFPDDIPDDCPPFDAPYAGGVFFRVVKTNPPGQDEFPTYAELKKIDPKRQCECYGLSVFSQREDAEFYALKFPYLGEMVATATLERSHGKVAATPRNVNGVILSHVTWWPFNEVVRHSLVIVEDEG